MLSKAREKNREKLKEGPKCSIMGPQNLGSEDWTPPAWIRTWSYWKDLFNRQVMYGLCFILWHILIYKFLAQCFVVVEIGILVSMCIYNALTIGMLWFNKITSLADGTFPLFIHIKVNFTWANKLSFQHKPIFSAAEVQFHLVLSFICHFNKYIHMV